MEYIVAGMVFIGLILFLAWQGVKSGATSFDEYDPKYLDQNYEDIVGA